MQRTGLFFLVGLLLVVSCASGTKRAANFRAQNRTNLLKLSRGITTDSVLAIMGTNSITVRYGAPLDPNRVYQTYNNPYRSELFVGPGDTLKVLYYYTDIKRQDGAITDDELTPLIFKDNILVGWGHSILGEVIQKYEIRIR